jgi:rRNA processing protein Krr1/Pno1
VEVGRAAPSIVGTKGATIEALRKLTGAAIEIERGSSVVTIKGTKVAVKSAQLEILKLVTDTPLCQIRTDCTFMANLTGAHR